LAKIDHLMARNAESEYVVFDWSLCIISFFIWPRVLNSLDLTFVSFIELILTSILNFSLLCKFVHQLDFSPWNWLVRMIFKTLQRLLWRQFDSRRGFALTREQVLDSPFFRAKLAQTIRSR
jgi:hypothetical protein